MIRTASLSRQETALNGDVQRPEGNLRSNAIFRRQVALDLLTTAQIEKPYHDVGVEFAGLRQDVTKSGLNVSDFVCSSVGRVFFPPVLLP
ncbi:MAG: hypothetical protein KDA85_00995 [Planctomycetaceae bacterium]|nr:hypothetical protein [Planctomycetaceae bacterium]